MEPLADHCGRSQADSYRARVTKEKSAHRVGKRKGRRCVLRKDWVDYELNLWFEPGKFGGTWGDQKRVGPHKNWKNDRNLLPLPVGSATPYAT